MSNQQTSSARGLPHVSIIVVTFEREEPLLATLRDLLNQDYPSYDILVVDQNHPPLESVRKLAAASEGRLRVVPHRPPNVCEARNAGVLATEGEILIYVDDDVSCERDFVAAHAAVYSDPIVGGVAGWVDAAESKNVIQPPGPWWDRVVGCNMSFRRTAVEQAQGFDPNFKSVPAYGEETELAIRIRRAGYRIAVAAQARVFHHLAPAGGQRLRDARSYWLSYTANQVLFFFKTHPWHHRLVFPAWLLKLWHTVRRLSGKQAKMTAFLSGVREGLRMLAASRKNPDFLSRARAAGK